MYGNSNEITRFATNDFGLEELRAETLSRLAGVLLIVVSGVLVVTATGRFSTTSISLSPVRPWRH